MEKQTLVLRQKENLLLSRLFPQFQGLNLDCPQCGEMRYEHRHQVKQTDLWIGLFCFCKDAWLELIQITDQFIYLVDTIHRNVVNYEHKINPDEITF